MKILGISDGHDSGAALVVDDKIKDVLNEERLSRIKLNYGFPENSINKILEINDLMSVDIDKIVIASHFQDFLPKVITEDEFYEETNMNTVVNLVSKTSSLAGFFMKSDKFIGLQKIALSMIYSKRKDKLMKLLKEKGFDCDIEFVEHHLCHAASAYYTSGMDDALIITSDAAGDGLSSTVSVGEKKEIKKLKEIGSYNSIAKFYSYVTELCGFKPARHEGKITGLAAYGTPIYLEKFKEMVIYNNGDIKNIFDAKHKAAIEKIRKEIGEFKKEDLAASVQQHIEDEVGKFVEYWVKKTGKKKLVLAGGLFANVKMNQVLHELVDEIYVHPHMGDGGLALGAVFAFSKPNPFKINDAYFGLSYTDEYIEKLLKKERLEYKKFDTIEKEVAVALAQGKVVARFHGRMEYGPRALGNRSILYQTKDKTVNDWLNKKLDRTEFMPFAPVTLWEKREDCYLNMKGAEHAAKFMTITFECTEEMKKSCPAVVHLDGTARPQLIKKEDNESYYDILESYYKLTGIPSLINTSFNMHEEPIVCTPEDAVRSFKQGSLDYLAIGKFLVRNVYDM